MNTSKRHTFKLLALALAMSSVGLSALAHDDNDGLRSGTVFTSTNSASGNELLAYAQGKNGALVLVAREATQGQGSGAGLGSQGAVTLSTDGQHLFVVNAQSNTVSTFVVKDKGLRLTSVVASGGVHPISVTEFDGVVYVLNDGGAGNVAGFRNDHGELKAIAGSVQPLSAAGGTAPAQVSFGSDGDVLLVTEKGANRLVSYRVKPNGGIGAPVVTASAGTTPFGFAFDRRNHVFVSEAFGGAANASALSSYRFDLLSPAKPWVVSASVGTTQTAACWVAVTPNGRYAYTTNAGSGSVSSFRILPTGKVTLSNAVAANIGTGSSPTDVAVSEHGRHLYVSGSRSLTISSFHIGHDGSLSAGDVVGGLPAGFVGLAAN